MDTSVILVAIIVAFGSITGPLILSQLSARQRKAEREEDWKRQDEVASRAEQAAQAIVVSNRQNSEATLASSKVVIGKLETVHKLVNSNLTASKQATLAALQQTLAVMRLPGAPEDPDLLATVNQQAHALVLELDRRRKADEAVQPGIEATTVAEQELAALPPILVHEPIEVDEPVPSSQPAPQPAVVSTDPDAAGTPVVIEGTMTTPPTS